MQTGLTLYVRAKLNYSTFKLCCGIECLGKRSEFFGRIARNHLSGSYRTANGTDKLLISLMTERAAVFLSANITDSRVGASHLAALMGEQVAVFLSANVANGKGCAGRLSTLVRKRVAVFLSANSTYCLLSTRCFASLVRNQVAVFSSADLTNCGRCAGSLAARVHLGYGFGIGLSARAGNPMLCFIAEHVRIFVGVHYRTHLASYIGLICIKEIALGVNECVSVCEGIRNGDAKPERVPYLIFRAGDILDGYG